MKCKECAEARPFAEDAVMCLLYGVIIRAEHECTLKGGRKRGNGDHRGPVPGETEIRDTERGDPGGGAGVVPGSGA